MRIIAAEKSDRPSVAATRSGGAVVPRAGGAARAAPRRGSFGRAPKPFTEMVLSAFFSNMATLLNSGIPLIKSLEALAMDETFKKAGPTIHTIVKDIRSGCSFAGALDKHPECFSPLILSLLRAAEKSGSLVEALERIADSIERTRDTKAQIRGALTYPTIVVVLGAGAVAFLMAFVVPIFQETYDKAGMTLPTITVVLITVSDIVQKTWWIALLVLITSFISYRHYRNHPAVRSLRDKLLIRLPVLGPVFRGVVVGRFVQSFGSLMSSGVSIKESLLLTERVVQHTEFAEMLREMRLAVARGEGMSRKLSEYRTLFPPLLTQMMTLGEKSGKLGSMVIQVGQFVEKDLKRRTQQMSMLLEPIVTIGMAAMIGTVALAIYLPMFDMFKKVE